jgi:cyclophilin family peptidyl-prolyl cis-trans isomerase/HEAT repeat protein
MTGNLRILAAFVAVLLFAAFAYFLYDTLRPRTREEKLAEIIHLEDQRLIDEGLVAYLEADSSEIRARAALAIGRIGGDQAGDLLIRLVREDPSIDVAATAAFGLGLVQKPEFALPLLDIASDLPSAVTAKAVEAAGRMVDSTRVDVTRILITFLTHPSPDVREAACYGLFHCTGRHHANVVQALLKTESDPYVRIAGLYMLARLQAPDVEETYVQFLAESEPFARIMALRGLRAVSGLDAVRYSAIALNDADQRVVAEAIATLATKETDDAARKLADRLVRETDEKLIVALISALQRMESSLGEAQVMSMLETSPPPNILNAAVRYLAVIQGDRSVNLIDSILNNKPIARVRAACAEAYGLIDNRNVVQRLAVLFGDEDPMVRAAAFNVLTDADSTNETFYIDKALNDPDYVLVSLAVDRIGRLKLKTYLPTLKTMMSRGTAIDTDVRRSILGAITPWLEAANRDSIAHQILVAGILDQSYPVRKDAAELYQEHLDEDRWSAVYPVTTRIGRGAVERAIKKYKANPYAEVTTSRGRFEFELFFDTAPLTVMNFISQVEDDFFDGLTFHRVIPNFVAQGGCPRGDGWGGPGYSIRDEYSDEPYGRGTVGIATSGKDTGGSQFFVTHSPQPHLEARYTIFGQVIESMDVVDQLVVGDVIENIEIRKGQI